MTRLRKQTTAIASLSVLLATTIGGTTAQPLLATWMVHPSLVLGASAFPLPTNVPVGTTIRIGGSSSMETINKVLKRRFEQQFVGTDVVLNTQGTGPAIKDVLDGNADLAAIGRSLTEQEKAQGLVPVAVSRHKIAIIVGSQNPFKGDLTFEQFAKIFRGEIKDWAQLGGEPGPIRFIDRPDNSDTRQAFRNYPVFKQAPFVTGKTARQLAQDSTSQVVQALGTDGIGYAIADQLAGRGDVRVLTMHKTLPSNPKYPFSQPLIYVYKGPQPNPSAQAFLGFATAPASRQTIETARKEGSAVITANPELVSPSPKLSVSLPPPSPSVTPAPQAATPAPSDTGLSLNSVPWWLWLLALPLLGGLFWWWLRGREAPYEPEESIAEPLDAGVALEELIVPIPEVVAPLLETTQPVGQSRIILVPRNCTDAYAYWEIPDDAKEVLKQRGAQKLVLRLYDVTGVALEQQPPNSLQEFDCEADACDRHLPIRTDDRDYLAELGYVAEDGCWLQVARSEPIRVPACNPPKSTNVTETEQPTPVSIINEPSPTLLDDTVTIGGAPVTGGVVEGEGASTTEDGESSTNALTHSMLADDRSHLLLNPEVSQTATSQSTLPADSVVLASGSGAAPMSLRSNNATKGLPNRPTDNPLHGIQLSDNLPKSQSQVFLVPRNAQSAYIHWTVTQEDKDALKHQGGHQLMLRVYDVMGTDTASTCNVQQFVCNEWERDQLVPIPVSNLDYVAELGYTTLDGRFLTLARSPSTRVPGA
ncbi:MAG: DUF4912 domain-containing protein [Leptolyngbya sp. BL-A-14]